MKDRLLRGQAFLLAVAIGLVLGLVVLPEASLADDVDGPVVPDAMVSFNAQEISQAVEPATGADVTPFEDAAVADYVDELTDDGVVVDERDVEVGTLVSDDFAVAVVKPEEDVDVTSIVVQADPDTGEITASSKVVEDEDPGMAQGGPGMGWPNWDTSFHASVKLTVYMKYSSVQDPYFKMGSATFQTVRRKFTGDGPDIDSYQIGRMAVATPVSPSTVQQLWLSQQLTPYTQARAREWIYGNTSPLEGFSKCSDGMTLNLFDWVGVPINDCSDYSVFTGAIGHQRISMDQGAYSGGGQRSVGYTSGFTVNDGTKVSADWYEFVTFRDGNVFTDAEKKCKSNEKGPTDDTESFACYMPEGDGEQTASREGGATATRPLMTIRGDAGGWYAYDTGLYGSGARPITSITIQGAERTYVNEGGVLYEVYEDESGDKHRASTGINVGAGSPISAAYINYASGRIDVYVNINGALYDVYGDSSGWHMGDTGIRIGAGSPIAATYINGNWGRIYVNINGALNEVYGDSSGWHMGDTGIRIGAGSPISATYINGNWGRIYVNNNGALNEVYGDSSGWHLGGTGIWIGAGSPISATYSGGPWGRIYVNSNGALNEVYGDSSGWHMVDTSVRIGAGALLAATYVSGPWASVMSS